MARNFGLRYNPNPNDPVRIPAIVSDVPERERMDTGNAAQDGYTVIARASRFDGHREIATGYDETYPSID